MKRNLSLSSTNGSMNTPFFASEKLSEKEAFVMAAIEGHADGNLSELAKELRIRGHVLRRILQRLIDRKIIRGVSATLDCTRLGYQEFLVQFSLSTTTDAQRVKIVAFLREFPGVNVIDEVGGEHQYALYLYAKDAHAVSRLLKDVVGRFGAVLRTKEIAVVLSCEVYNRKYLSTAAKPEVFLSYPKSDPPVAVDRQDTEILRGLSKHPNVSLRELARVLKIPPSTLHQRVASLKNRSVLLGFHYAFNMKMLGVVSFCLAIYTQGVDPNLLVSLRDFSRAHPQVTMLVEYVGAFDYILFVEATAAQSAGNVTEELYRRFSPRIQTIRTIPIFSRIHFSSFPFAEHS